MSDFYTSRCVCSGGVCKGDACLFCGAFEDPCQTGADGPRGHWTGPFTEEMAVTETGIVTDTPTTHAEVALFPPGVLPSEPLAWRGAAGRGSAWPVASGLGMGSGDPPPEGLPDVPRDDKGRYVNDSVHARFPGGTDPLQAIRETMGVFMERTDGGNDLPWWARLRWWHGGPQGFDRGSLLLPPSVTGVVPGLGGTDKDSVYVTTDRSAAIMFSARHDHPCLYEVTDFGGIEPIFDDVLPTVEVSKRVPRCKVHRIEQISNLELRRVLYELNAE